AQLLSVQKSKIYKKKDIKDIIETMRTAHSQSIILMDLRRYNFIRKNLDH
ncbi:2971_t:CDS:1, partial [Racocetra persica]